MNKLVIGMCGSACTGKTTLVEKLTENNPRFKPVMNFARTWIENGGYANWSSIPPNERRVMQEDIRDMRQSAIEEVKLHYSVYSGAIADRTSIDNLAYVLCTYSQSEDQEVQKWVIEYKQKCLEDLKLYDHIIYIPQFSIKYCDDGLRSPNVNVEDHIGYIIRGIFEEQSYIENNPFKYCILEESDLLKRIEYVQNIINTFYKG